MLLSRKYKFVLARLFTLQEAGQYNALLNEALKLDKNSDAYQIASKLQSGTMKATSRNIGNLFSRYVRDGGDFRSFVAAAAAQSETTTVGETLSAMDSGTLALFAHLFNTDSSQSVLSELNQGKRPSNELLKQFADETGLTDRATAINHAYQAEQLTQRALQDAQARYVRENTQQARSALTSAQAAYEGAVGTLEKAANALGINSEEGLQNLHDALGGTEVAVLPENAGVGLGQIAGYGEQAPSGLTLPGAELFAQENAAYSGNGVPTLTLPGAELFTQDYTLNSPVDTSPQNGNMDVGGQELISTDLLTTDTENSKVSGNELKKLGDAVNIKGYKILESRRPKTVNDEWALRGYDKPPYASDTEALIVAAGYEKYVRVFSYNADGTSNKLGGWLMRKADIDGLSPKQIANLFALPKIPTHICDVDVPYDFQLEAGLANGIPGWGEGKGLQFDTMGKRLPLSSFRNERALNQEG